MAYIPKLNSTTNFTLKHGHDAQESQSYCKTKQTGLQLFLINSNYPLHVNSKTYMVWQISIHYDNKISRCMLHAMNISSSYRLITSNANLSKKTFGSSLRNLPKPSFLGRALNNWNHRNKHGYSKWYPKK